MMAPSTKAAVSCRPRAEGIRAPVVVFVVLSIGFLAINALHYYHPSRPLTREPSPTGLPNWSAGHYPCGSEGGADQYSNRTLASLQHAIWTRLPRPGQFLEQFRNQCWYDPLPRASRTQPRLLRCIPKVFLAGFPKCGTSQLHAMIVKSPEVVRSVRKELHWWTRNVSEGTVQQYLDYFSPATSHIETHPTALTIDASPSTIWETGYTRDVCDTPRLMSAALPDAKYVVIMREPVSRLYSDFLYFCKNRGRFRGVQESFHRHVLTQMGWFGVCVLRHPLSVCARNFSRDSPVMGGACRGVRLGVGVYYDHIRRWLDLVSKERFLFLRTEDMAADPYGTVQQVWNFLAVEHRSRQEMAFVLGQQANSNIYADMLPATRQLLTDFYRPYNKMLARILDDTRYLWEGWTGNQTTSYL